MLTTDNLAHRFDPVLTRQRPDPAGSPPVMAADSRLAVQRGLGNDFLQRTAECGGPDRVEEGGCRGGCGGCALSRMVQPSLTVGPAGGPDEQEADRIADRVVGMAAHDTAAVGGGPRLDIQRLPAARVRSGGTVDVALPTGGRPLSTATRALMEPRFGQDFAGVRLHTGPDAHRFATGIRARAFTHGHDIYLRQGESEYDRRLMAHELTHVVQQRGGATAAVQRAPDDSAGPPRATQFTSVTMEFDGSELVVRGDGKELFRFSAQSGRPIRLSAEHARECGADPETDSYMNDKRFVGIQDAGPIPEGTYTFAAPAIEKFSFGDRLRLEFGGVFGQHDVTVGGRPIHAGDWGTGRVALQPRGRLRQGPCGDVHKRSGFFLHGGILAGSSGCIDIGSHFDTVADFLAGYRRPVVVTVEYKQLPSSVGFFTGLSGAVAYGRFQLGHGPSLGLGAEFGPTGARGVASVGYDALLQWAGGALTAGVRLDIPFNDKEAFVRVGLSGGLDFRIFGPLYGRLFGGYDWDVSGASRVQGPEVGGGLRLDLNRYQIEAVYNVLRPAAQDERVHQALVQMGFKF